MSNDDTYVAWIEGTPMVEISTMDSALGTVFYTLGERSDTPPKIERQTLRCLACHDTFSLQGGGVPNFLFLSSYAIDDGKVLMDSVASQTTDATPLTEHWGGWYVTGQFGGLRQLGNLVPSDATRVISPAGRRANRYNGSPQEPWGWDMATRLRIVLIAVVAVLAAYTGAAWVIGINVENQLARYEQQVLTNAPYIEQAARKYDRGVFGATEEVTYRLGGPFAHLSQTLAAGGAGSSLELTVRNTIHHGPLPQLRSVAFATVDTELVPPPMLASKLNAMFAGRSALAIHTTMSWLGGRTTGFSIPAFQAQLPAGATLISRGLSGSGESTRDSGSISGQIVSGGFDIQGPKGSVQVGNIGFDAKMRRVFDALYVGDAHLTLATVTVGGPSGAARSFFVKNLTLSSSSQADSEFVNSEGRVAADQLDAGSFSFSHVVYGIRVLHLEGTSLAALRRALQQSRSRVAAGDPTAQANMVNALHQYGIDLLVHDPVIQIQSLAFATPEGEFHLAAGLSAHGVRREDLTAGPAALIALTRYLDADVDLRIDDALLTKLLASTPRGPALSAQLDSLEKQGYLQRDGKAWTSRIGFHAGKLTINGQSYPPVAATF